MLALKDVKPGARTAAHTHHGRVTRGGGTGVLAQAKGPGPASCAKFIYFGVGFGMGVSGGVIIQPGLLCMAPMEGGGGTMYAYLPLLLPSPGLKKGDRQMLSVPRLPMNCVTYTMKRGFLGRHVPARAHLISKQL